MNKVSDNFIEAMNGVLNGEKWTREIWKDNNKVLKLRGGSLCLCDLKSFYVYSLFSYDMQADDWHKLD